MLLTKLEKPWTFPRLSLGVRSACRALDPAFIMTSPTPRNTRDRKSRETDQPLTKNSSAKKKNPYDANMGIFLFILSTNFPIGIEKTIIVIGKANKTYAHTV